MNDQAFSLNEHIDDMEMSEIIARIRSIEPSLHMVPDDEIEEAVREERKPSRGKNVYFIQQPSGVQSPVITINGNQLFDADFPDLPRSGHDRPGWWWRLHCSRFNY